MSDDEYHHVPFERAGTRRVKYGSMAMPSDDKLRRIARRVLGLASYRARFTPSAADTIEDEAVAALREEIDALATKISSQNWIQSDGELIATVVNTTDY